MANKNKQAAATLTNKEEKAEKTKLQGELTVLQNAIAEAKKQADLIEDRSADIASLDEAFAKAQASFVKEKNDLDRKLETLQNEVDDLGSQKKRRTEELGELKSQISEVTSELEKLTEEAGAAIASRDGAINEQQTKVKALKDHINKLEEEKERVKAIVETRDELDKEIGTRQAEIERIKEEQLLGSKRLDSLNKNVAATEAKRDAAQGELDELIKQSEDITKDIADKQKAFEADHKKREADLVNREATATLREENLSELLERLKKAKSELEKKAGHPLNKIKITLEDGPTE